MIFSLLLIWICSLTTTAEPVDMFFSGGGIRAAYGTLIAMCETLTYWNEHKTFTVDNIVGLSGGAWGVSFLGATDTSPCELVAKVKTIAKWGEIQKFKPARCSYWDGIFIMSCYNGWTHDIGKWQHELLNGIAKRDVTDRDMNVPEGFSQNGFGGKHLTRVYVQTDPCHFGFPPARWAYGDGACVVSATSEKMYCVGDTNNKLKLEEKLDEIHMQECRVGNEIVFSDDGYTYDVKWNRFNYNNLLAYSSSAFASATAASNGAVVGVMFTSLIAGGDKTTPELKCMGDQKLRSSFCDAGGECNLPLGALEVIYHESVLFNIEQHAIKQFITFDYSDNKGDQIKAVKQCLDKWSKKKGWELVGSINTPWGYTLLINAAEDADVHHVNDQFILHVVLFRGVNLGDNLVKKFPTMQYISPTYLKPALAKEVHTEYAGFLRASLFGTEHNPFTVTAAEWKKRIGTENVLKESEEFLEREAKTKDSQQVLQPAVH